MPEFTDTDFNAPSFLQLTIVGWIDVFSCQKYVDVALKNLAYCQQQKGLDIFAYVVMTNQIQMIARQKGQELNKIIGHYKSYSAKQILTSIEESDSEERKDWMLHVFRYHARFKAGYDQYHFWQHDNHSTKIANRDLVLDQISRVHNSPVIAGYVKEPQHWMYSSACPFSGIEVVPY